jgi:hypothetical protein
MKSLIWKECRENLQWAVLPVLLLGAMTVIIGPPHLQKFMMPEWLLLVSLFTAGSGAALGLLQVFFEAGGDKRSLLLHRPISRSRIFLAKAITGVALYLLALGLPFVWSVAWAATPGHFAVPFRWGMALPWLADVLTGVVYYFAGMLAAQREARWYGSRGLGLGAAVLCSFLVWTLPEFWQALLAVVVLGGLLAVAAWGSFLTGGAYAPQPRLAKAALAGAFLAGLLVLSVLAKFAVGAWLQPDTKRYYTLDRQGRVLPVLAESDKRPVVTDLDGQVPPELRGKDLDRSAIREIEIPLSGAAWPRSHSYRNCARYFLPYANSTTSGEEHWYYVPDQGRLVGYEKESKRFLGSIGPDGFAPSGGQPRERFRGELSSYPTFLYDAGAPAYLCFPDGVYTVDFPRRAVQPLFTPPGGETVLWAARWKDEKQKVSLAIVGTDKSVHALDEAGALVFSAPLAYDRENYGVVRVGRLEDRRRFVVWYEPSWYLRVDAGKIMPSYVVEYEVDDADGRKEGREVARRTVPPRPLDEPVTGEALFGLATPPAEGAVLVGGPRYLFSAAQADGGTEVQPLTFLLAFPAQYFIPGAGWDTAPEGGAGLAFKVLALLSAAACAFVCFLLARRYAFSHPRRIGWALGGFAFGWVGLLLMLTLQEWPARVRCPSCGRERRVDRDRCEPCGAPHALPATDGTEIFKPATEDGWAIRTPVYQAGTLDGEDRP